MASRRGQPPHSPVFSNVDTFSQEFRQNMNTKIVPSRSKLVPGTFKTEPCWKHLDFDKKKSIRRYAETVDPVVSGQKSSLGRMDVQENEISKKELLPTPMGRALPGLVRHRLLQKKNRL
jgi:hypothetical protein